MNREIKFRVWDYKMGKWTNPHFFNLNGEFIGELGFYQLFDIQQFTGLKDKNGKEVYEGDFIKEFDFDEIQGSPLVVQWGKAYGHFGFSPYDIVNKDYYDFYGGWPIEFEVIGNIFDNPELIQNA